MHSKSIRGPIRLLSLTVMLCIVPIASTYAQTGPTLTVMYSFPKSYSHLSPIVQASDGNLYGATSDGGYYTSFGEIYRVAPNGIESSVYTFSGGSDGAYPYAGLVQGTDGLLYGTTASGGMITCNPDNGCGTVFKLTPGGVLTTLYTFTDTYSSGVLDGGHPETALVQGVDGSFYGSTYDNIFYSITSGGVYTTLHQLINNEGNVPNSALVQGKDGNFYGTTLAGGDNSVDSQGDGTIFKMTPDGTFTSLYLFNDASTGTQPGGLVQGSDGNFYGSATDKYSSYYSSNLFKITPEGVLTMLAHLDGETGVDTLVSASDGNFYGTVAYGGPNYDFGSIFQMTPAGVVTTLYSFAGSDGSHPFGLVHGNDGNFYGLTSAGGQYGFGEIFKITDVITAATPVFSPAGGSYHTAQRVTISDTTPGAFIYYTTDGSTPTTASTLYTGPVPILFSKDFQAIAVAANEATSAVASASYTISRRPR